MTTETMIADYKLIRQGAHSSWEGDGVLNSETFVRRLAQSSPDLAVTIAAEIEAAEDAENRYDLPPGALARICRLLRRPRS